jgi:hypothetical protein
LRPKSPSSPPHFNNALLRPKSPNNTENVEESLDFLIEARGLCINFVGGEDVWDELDDEECENLLSHFKNELRKKLK